MPEKREYDCFVLKFAPYGARTDHVSIAVAMVERSAAPEFTEVRFVRDWRTLRCLRPDLEIDLLDAMKREIESRFAAHGEREQLLKYLSDSGSNGIQLTAAAPLVTDNPAAEMSVMEALHLRVFRPSPEEAGVRATMLRRLRSAFEKEGVWNAMEHDMAAAEFTHKGDPLKIDCGYRPNGVMKMFQAVPLPSGVNLVKSLAFSWPQLVEGIRSKKGAGASLTALVDERLDYTDDAVSFALNILQNSNIAVAEMAMLPHIAATAREELGLARPS